MKTDYYGISNATFVVLKKLYEVVTEHLSTDHSNSPDNEYLIINPINMRAYVGIPITETCDAYPLDKIVTYPQGGLSREINIPFLVNVAQKYK